MKRHIKKYFSLKHYIAVLRRHPVHMQHVYAFIFAGSITSLIAFVILYTEYGFWHETYVRSESVESVTVDKETPPPPAPREVFSRFLDEAKVQFQSISMPSTGILDGKETYTREEN